MAQSEHITQQLHIDTPKRPNQYFFLKRTTKTLTMLKMINGQVLVCTRRLRLVGEPRVDILHTNYILHQLHITPTLSS